MPFKHFQWDILARLSLQTQDYRKGGDLLSFEALARCIQIVTGFDHVGIKPHLADAIFVSASELDPFSGKDVIKMIPLLECCKVGEIPRWRTGQVGDLSYALTSISYLEAPMGTLLLLSSSEAEGLLKTKLQEESNSSALFLDVLGIIFAMRSQKTLQKKILERVVHSIANPLTVIFSKVDKLTRNSDSASVKGNLMNLAPDLGVMLKACERILDLVRAIKEHIESESFDPETLDQQISKSQKPDKTAA